MNDELSVMMDQLERDMRISLASIEQAGKTIAALEADKARLVAELAEARKSQWIEGNEPENEDHYLVTCVCNERIAESRVTRAKYSKWVGWHENGIGVTVLAHMPLPTAWRKS